LTGDNLLKIVTGFVKEDMTGAEGFTPQCTRHGGFPAGSITIESEETISPEMSTENLRKRMH
jgi:hypothetical protein